MKINLATILLIALSTVGVISLTSSNLSSAPQQGFSHYGASSGMDFTKTVSGSVYTTQGVTPVYTVPSGKALLLGGWTSFSDGQINYPVQAVRVNRADGSGNFKLRMGHNSRESFPLPGFRLESGDQLTVDLQGAINGHFNWYGVLIPSY